MLQRVQAPHPRLEVRAGRLRPALQLALPPRSGTNSRVNRIRFSALVGGLFLAMISGSAALASVSDASVDAPVPAPKVREAKPVGDVESEIADAAKLYNLDPVLVRAVAQQESGLKHDARSRRGALGVMQLMPGTASELGYDAADLRGNIRAGAAYLSMMMESFGGDVKKALAAYNAGPGAVQKYGGVPPFRETRNYVASIMSKLGVKRRAQIAVEAARHSQEGR